MDLNKIVSDAINTALDNEVRRLNDNLEIIKEVMKSNNQDIELLTVKEAKKILKIGIPNIYKLIEKGEIKALDLYGLKIPRYEVQNFISRNLGKETCLNSEISDVI